MNRTRAQAHFCTSRKGTLAQHMTILLQWRVSWACVGRKRKGGMLRGYLLSCQRWLRWNSPSEEPPASGQVKGRWETWVTNNVRTNKHGVKNKGINFDLLSSTYHFDPMSISKYQHIFPIITFYLLLICYNVKVTQCLLQSMPLGKWKHDEKQKLILWNKQISVFSWVDLEKYDVYAEWLPLDPTQYGIRSRAEAAWFCYQFLSLDHQCVGNSACMNGFTANFLVK